MNEIFVGLLQSINVRCCYGTSLSVDAFRGARLQLTWEEKRFPSGSSPRAIPAGVATFAFHHTTTKSYSLNHQH